MREAEFSQKISMCPIFLIRATVRFLHDRARGAKLVTTSLYEDIHDSIAAIVAETSIDFSEHDLRRTFETTAGYIITTINDSESLKEWNDSAPVNCLNEEFASSIEEHLGKLRQSADRTI